MHSDEPIPCLRIDEGDHDVAGSIGGRKPLMIVSQSSWENQSPAFTSLGDWAVISYKTYAATL